FRNPFRSGVSILASLVSTALVVMSLSMVDSLDYLMRFQFEKISHEDISVSIRDPQGRKAESEIGALSGVADVEPQLVVACDFVNGPRKKRTAITGLVRHNRLNTPLDALGRPIVIPDDGLVLTRKLAEILRVAVGDSVRLRPLIARRQEVVAPVAAIVETFLGLGAYAEIGYLGRLLGEEEPANVILASRSPGADRAALFEEFKKRPTVVGIGERARSLTQLDETFGKTMGAMIWVMVFLSGLIAFGSVFNAALVSLSERQREVGTLRVLGYSTREVAGVFSGESLLLNGFGIGVGLLAGIGLTHLVLIPYDTEMYRFPAIIYPSRLLQSAAVMAGFIVVAQVIILWMIRRLDWLEALKVRE
ncbi:MAG TPA: ABC transporter permease, partial [Sumerlaeia bacterium]|nr:ABC transporter permease [Sumerlaeia bacterium]